MASTIAFGGTNSGFQVGENHGHLTQILHSGSSLTEECLRDLQTTNPHDDKDRIESTNGGLLKDSYRWILENEEFKQWQNSPSSLLWIRGDPGKGKTMLLCGIIDELSSTLEAANVSFFFCQATDSRINTATAVLRGLIYSLVENQPSLLCHVMARYSQSGKTLFQDTNAWHALSKIFTDILRDPAIQKTYLIIDALDECIADLPSLLDLIVQESSAYPHVQWIVSSRNWPDIEEHLHTALHMAPISLELNEISVSKAVSKFVQHKVCVLSKAKKYNLSTRDAISNYLISNAHGTFLWVALICQDLTRTPRWQALKKLESFPPKLDALYRRMIDQIRKSEGAELYKRILAVMSTVYRPITLDELKSYIDMPDIIDDYDALSEIIAFCGSFLSIREDTVIFVHQSAKDFLLSRELTDIMPTGIEGEHHTIFLRSLNVMSNILRRDISGIQNPGLPFTKVKKPGLCPLIAIKYACVHWVEHLQDCNPVGDFHGDLADQGSVDLFLRQKYLYWLEALTLLRSMSEGITAMLKLEALLRNMGKSQEVINRAYDALRFIRSHRTAIENYPLQIYSSALLFSPARSMTSKCFKKEMPEWVTMNSTPEEYWSRCLQTFEADSSIVAWSHVNNRLASVSYETIKIWDLNTGQHTSILDGQMRPISIAWSHNGTRLASMLGAHDQIIQTSGPDPYEGNTIKIWNPNTCQCISTLRYIKALRCMAWSYDGSRIASVSHDNTISIRDPNTGQYVSVFGRDNEKVRLIAWSYDDTRIASLSEHGTIRGAIKIWNPETGQCISLLEGVNEYWSFAWSYDGTRLASVSFGTVDIWDPHTSQRILALGTEASHIYGTSIAWSKDGSRIASASNEIGVQIWNPITGQCISVLAGHKKSISSIAWSYDGTQFVTGSIDSTVRVWDPVTAQCTSILSGHTGKVKTVFWSQDGTRLVSNSRDGTIKIWDSLSDQSIPKYDGHSDMVQFIAWSYDGTRLATASNDKTVRIWEKCTGKCISTLTGHQMSVGCISWLPYSTWLSSVAHNELKVWNSITRQCILTLKYIDDVITSFAWSHDGLRLALATKRIIKDADISAYEIRIWDLTTRQYVWSHAWGSEVSDISWSYDRTRLGVGAEKQIKILDLASSQCISTETDHANYIGSISWARDGTHIASVSSFDNAVNVWDADTGQCIWKLEVGGCEWLRFDEVNSNILHTNVGTVDLQPCTSGAFSRAISGGLVSPRRVGYGLNHDSCWITFAGQDLLWLPPEYRPTRPFLKAISGTTVAIGCDSGRVLILTFSEGNPLFPVSQTTV
ncbi:hypothetical protein N7494_002559 [Penicillium frequentans]|uniref:NACHT domain-containing protein n=1 Tax=Penicillium frequentans TaxID=3151616 RepID=A0AAD6GKB6_9EURO|nr:hypothetical protein N7494_002559 [Penicillium glabrum]